MSQAGKTQDFTLDVPKHFNFAYDVIDKRGIEERTRLAMIWVSDQGECRKLTFWDFMVNSNKVANYLKSSGLRHGDRILLMMSRVPEWWYTVLGAMKLGVVTLPTATALSAREVAYRCSNANVRAIICDSDHVEKIDSIRDQLPSVSTFVAIDTQCEGWHDFHSVIDSASRQCVWLGSPPATRSTDTMLLYFTSGTTGYPKMVAHNQAYSLAHRITAQLWHGTDENSVHWTITDTGWAKLAWGALFGQWLLGTAIFVYNYRGKVNAQKILSLLEEYGITSFCAPPTLYRMLVLEDLEKYNFSELRSCTCAGEPLNPEVIERWIRCTGLQIREGYGQTETVCLIANRPGHPVKPGSMGCAMPTFDLQILDDELNVLPAGQEGVIAIRVKPNFPHGLFHGYLDDDKLNARVFQGDWYLTGDKASRDEDGYFWFVGRSDDVFKSSGYRISPFEVESALQEHPAVAESAVIGVPDEIRGQIIKAFVVLTPEYTASAELCRQLQDHVRKTKSPYTYPRDVEFVDELPKTVSGKIRRVELREREIRKMQGEGFQPPLGV